MSTGLLLRGGRGPDGATLELRIEAGRFTAPTPRRGDALLELGGARLLPGLINAHDHLQLNGLPRLRYRERYREAAEWIADLDPRLATDPQILAYRARPRAERLWLGGLKNLLAGTTTVLHHDPREACLDTPDFPVDVPVPGGWSHSLGLDGAAAVQASRRAAAPGRPWIIHAAEGLGTGSEFDALEALGALGPDTLLVHGVGLNAARQQRLADAGATLVWCPGSNLFLFSRTLDPGPLMARGCLLLGSDSRLSGERDLLAELGLARLLTGWSHERLERWVTADAAQRLRLPDRGGFAPGQRADLIALPPDQPLAGSARADLQLVLRAGRPRSATPELATAWPRPEAFETVMLDGRPRALAAGLTHALRATPLGEPGLELATLPCPESAFS
jgi:cytosine/adenosine deaminase-related metal-dependent hydrolase